MFLSLIGTDERSGDEFWDYNRQIDLEGFDSHQVYDILLAQSKQATLTLAKQKDEVSILDRPSSSFVVIFLSLSLYLWV